MTQFFSVIADGATDSFNESISVCFFEEGVPQEKFLGFQECLSGVTGEAIADNILTQLTNWQLQLQLLRGQAYDGVGAVAGKARGCSSLYNSEVS